MQISRKLARAKESGTARLSQIAREMKEAGREVYQLATGEPDFDTPSFVITAAYEAALSGQTRYTAVEGTPALREAIADMLRKEFDLECGIGQIIVGTGAKQLIFNALVASVNPGDEVIIPAPYWVSYPDMVIIADGNPVIVACPAKAGFKLSADDLEKSITEKTRWVILNSPCNPSGAVYGKDDLLALADVIRRHPRVAVMCDDIYEKIVFDGAKFATMAEVAPDLRDRTLTVNGLSKSHAMTGWRIGYAAGPDRLVSAMAKLQGQSTTNPSSVSQAAALAALRGPKEFLEDWRLAYQTRRNLVFDRLSAIPGLAASQPEGAFYHFVGCEELYGRRTPAGTLLRNDSEVGEYLLQASGAAVVPGAEFGCPGYFRLCFAQSDEILAAACARIGDAVASLS
ncbi:MAG: pyridoxal phosphate-dependent aminotransferase [Albidovulum sp.]|nr:pyridoxal phosphate-dependent aminotransferase [Albidovulum sp.]MDE0534147.1 pyridoxal phosphate-dependent aminotransferase [Albidovulum sp.]